MGIKEPLNLLIVDGEEESFFSFCRRDRIDGVIFMLSSTLFRNFAGVITDFLLSVQLPDEADIEAALRNFYREVNGNDEIIDRFISFQDFNFNFHKVIEGFDPEHDTRGMRSYFSEVVALYGLLVTWLDPREVAGGQLLTKLWLGDPDNHFFFKHRCRQFNSCPTAINNRFTFVHDSPGILPLCWAELMHAVYYKIKASVCPFCHTVYLFPKKNYQKATCGQPECKKANLIRQHGGLEGYRTWENERKKNKGGKRGRPRKNNLGSDPKLFADE